MTQQNFSNHIRYYTPHHFVFYPVILAGTIFSFWQKNKSPEHALEWLFIAIIFIIIGWLSYMTRQHYALTLQNRLVRSEMRLRYFILTGLNFAPLESKLSFGQIAALRFASDEELPALLQKASAENMAPKEIKASIRQWTPDYQRV